MTATSYYLTNGATNLGNTVALSLAAIRGFLAADPAAVGMRPVGGRAWARAWRFAPGA